MSTLTTAQMWGRPRDPGRSRSPSTGHFGARPRATLLGICDEAEALVVAKALQRADRWPQTAPLRTTVRPGSARAVAADPAELELTLASLGFFVCHADLEQELIRALGVAASERVLADHGALTAFRTFQGQPDQRDKDDPAMMRRFLGAGSGRKITFAAAFTEALPEGRVPPPLADPGAGWGPLIDIGATTIQADWPHLFRDHRDGRAA